MIAFGLSRIRAVAQKTAYPQRIAPHACLVVLLVVFAPRAAHSGEAASVVAPAAALRESAGDEAVAALVDGRPVRVREVGRLVRQAAAGAEEVNPAALPLLQAQALDELVKRRLVLAYARQTNSGPSDPQVEAALAEMKTTLRAQGRTLDEWLAAEGLSAEELRRELLWKLTWQKCLARYLTDERRRACFQAHRRQFDGTRMVVSQILLRPDAAAAPGAIGELVRQAESLRARILAGELSFEEAARQFSAAPTAPSGGRLGPIRRPFALEPGQISPPVRTPFGVHLIRCDGIEPGRKQWTEVRDQIDRYLERELLERLALFQATRTPPQYTGRVPYLKFGTRELVVP